jgi:hypothetical protein
MYKITIKRGSNNIHVTRVQRTIKIVRPSYIYKINTTGKKGPKGDSGEGVPAGGSTGQVLTKQSNTDYDSNWTNAGSGDMARAVYDPQNINDDAFDRANHTGTQTASTISDFDTEVSNNTDVAQNTTDRHTHVNKALLDTYNQSNADIADAVTKRHTHSNKTILDNITAAFTTADETKLDGIEAGAEVNTVDSVNSQTGAVSLDADDIDDTSTTQKFVTASDLTKLSNLSGTNTGDQDLSGLQPKVSGVDDTEIGYLNGVTSAIQTQIDGKVAKSGDSMSGNLTFNNNVGVKSVTTPGSGSVTRDILKLNSSDDVVLNGIDSRILLNGGDSTVVIETDNVNIDGASLSVDNDITLGGTVDGRDVAADGTKLDGIESGADVTDATNVASAGAVMTSGNQTVGGVKTFSSDPLIPDEAYGSGWNGSLEPPTKNAVYDKIETIGGGAVWGAITGTLSGQTDLNNALDGKVSVAGDTMTGALIVQAMITANHATVLPAYVGGSASLFLDNENGQTYEFFTNNGGQFGVYDFTTSQQPITIEPSSMTNAVRTDQYGMTSSGRISASGDLETSRGLVANNGQGDYDSRIAGDTLSHLFFTDGTSTTENIALVATGAPNWQSMDRGLFIGNAETVPTGNPSSGGFLYVESGALKYRGSSGTVTTIGNA